MSGTVTPHVDDIYKWIEKIWEKNRHDHDVHGFRKGADEINIKKSYLRTPFTKCSIVYTRHTYPAKWHVYAVIPGGIKDFVIESQDGLEDALKTVLNIFDGDPEPEVNPIVLTNSCQTKDEIEMILELYEIKYTKKSEYFVVDLFEVYPRQTYPLTEIPAHAVRSGIQTNFSNGKDLIEILSRTVTMRPPNFTVNAQWIAIGRLATIVEKLSRQH